MVTTVLAFLNEHNDNKIDTTLVNHIKKRVYADDCRSYMTCSEEWNPRKIKHNSSVPYKIVARNCSRADIEMYAEFFFSYAIFGILSIVSLIHVANHSSQCKNLVVKMLNPKKHSHKVRKSKFRPRADLFSLAHYRPRETSLWVYTVPRYPENHNPLLPLSLQQRLDDMNPKEFLTYVLKELTLEERESLMVDEKQRRKTFLVNWPYDDQRSGVKMAQAGFYSLNDYDRVQCVFCRGSLHKWDSSETPMAEHAKSFTFCRFVKGLECGNREYRSTNLLPEEMKNITKFTNEAKNSAVRSLRVINDINSFGICTNRAATIRYAPAASRLKTYAKWPAHCPITAQRMCEAGFILQDLKTRSAASFVREGIKQWRENDDPWEEHARWFPDCAFLIQQKGQGYVEEVHAKTPANKKSVRKTEAQKKEELNKTGTLSNQKEMFTLCLRLGHDHELVLRAFTVHKQQFADIKELVDLLYTLEDGDTIPASSPSPILATSNNFKATCPDEEKQLARQQQIKSSELGMFDGSENGRQYPLGCVLCERKTASFVPAMYVSLPCGHLIFCENCKNEEERLSFNPNHKVMCPLKTCQTQLTGAIKTIIA
ncbi:IAP1 [Bugula neritina]|uniref:IAP1 n=1 Tax=Bugula neritina TaxID=10212 RepID=A0A7J7JS07_BUGNE|nr:IAP1 [Bugula neritina]